MLAQTGAIVTFGIKPTYPETGFGYINSLTNKFVEKPDTELAKKYLEDGNYYWNSVLWRIVLRYMAPIQFDLERLGDGIF